MDKSTLEELLRQVQNGSLPIDSAVGQLQRLPFTESSYARVDHHRELRQGMPEVVFGQGKTVEQIVGICQSLQAAEQNVLVTRVEAESAEAILGKCPELHYDALGRCLYGLTRPIPRRFSSPVPVVTAGTSDLPVAHETLRTLELGGVEGKVVADVGVAGLHRLLSVLPELQAAPALICIAGMEGALPSVLGGLVRAPVVAVPTSVGYGASLGGLAALLGMLSSCASGVTVVNIDNGFGAAMAVLRMAVAQAEGASHG